MPATVYTDELHWLWGHKDKFTVYLRFTCSGPDVDLHPSDVDAWCPFDTWIIPGPKTLTACSNYVAKRLGVNVTHCRDVDQLPVVGTIRSKVTSPCLREAPDASWNCRRNPNVTIVAHMLSSYEQAVTCVK
jgi:hypothetical protein